MKPQAPSTKPQGSAKPQCGHALLIVCFLLLAAASTQAAELKLSELTRATNVVGSDLLLVTTGTVTKASRSIEVSNLLSHDLLVNGSPYKDGLSNALRLCTNNTVITLGQSTFGYWVTNWYMQADRAHVPLQLIDKTNITLRGVGPASRIQTTGYGFAMVVAGCSNVLIEGITWDGDYAANRYMTNVPYAANGVPIAGSSWLISGAIGFGTNTGVMVRKCSFVDWPDQALTQYDSWHTTDNLVIVDNWFDRVGTDYFSSSSNNMDGTCISTFMGNNVTVTGNQATRCLRFFEFDAGGKYYAGNWNFKNHLIKGNILDLHHESAVGYFWATNDINVTVSGVTVSDNIVRQRDNFSTVAPAPCFWFGTHVTNLVVRGNSLVGNGKGVGVCVGIYGAMTNRTWGAIVDGNTIQNFRVGMHIGRRNVPQSAMRGVLVQGNVFLQNGSVDVSAHGTDILVTRNVHIESGFAGSSQVIYQVGNNTFTVGETGGSYLSSNITFEANHLFAPGSNPTLPIYDGGNAATPGIRWINNYLVPNGTWGTFPYWGSSGTTDFLYVGQKYNTGSPESALAANVGSLVLRIDASGTTALYTKTNGTGSTGWRAMP